MTYREEFPDYAPETLPAIPAHWVDVSWHNDTCPSWEVTRGARTLYVYIDYADKALREFSSTPRFAVLEAPADGDHSPEEVLASDDWSDVLACVDGIEREVLGAEYVEKIGYNPFEDDPSISVEEVAKILAEYDEIAADGTSTYEL